MGQRLDLHALLVDLIGRSDRVYYQPPENIRMSYPCFIYELDDMDVQRADNTAYAVNKAYSVTYIDPNPDNQLIDQIIQIPMCSFDRHFTADHNHHYTFNIFF